MIRAFELDTPEGAPIGKLRGALTGDGLALLCFPSTDFDAELRRLAGGAAVGVARRHAALTELRGYFAGGLRRFSVPVDLSLATPFGRTVLERLARVPYGTAVTYGELARRAGSPGAARAVGGVMGRNPVSVVVP